MELIAISLLHVALEAHWLSIADKFLNSLGFGPSITIYKPLGCTIIYPFATKRRFRKKRDRVKEGKMDIGGQEGREGKY